MKDVTKNCNQHKESERDECYGMKWRNMMAISVRLKYVIMFN